MFPKGFVCRLDDTVIQPAHKTFRIENGLEMTRTMPQQLFAPRWILTTLLVLVAVGVMVRLGLWQLDRLEQRRAFNTRVQAQISAPPLDLNEEVSVNELPDMEYRQVVVTGKFDPYNEILLRGQYRDGLPGYHLLTPLVIEGGDRAVLVDRGFIPLEEGSPEARAKYALGGPITVRGVIQRTQSDRRFGAPDPTLAPDETRMDAWNAVRLDRIEHQMPFPLLPVYVALDVESAPEVGPYPQIEPPDLSEGSHFSYAIQWFSFAAVLGLGYPFFVRKQLQQGDREQR